MTNPVDSVMAGYEERPLLDYRSQPRLTPDRVLAENETA
jgi:hypothetical protein